MSVWWLMKVLMLPFGGVGSFDKICFYFAYFMSKFSTRRKKKFHRGTAFGSFKLLSFRPSKVYSVAYCSQVTWTWFTREREGMVLCGKFYTTLYCQCKYQLPEGFWRQHTAIIKPTDIYSWPKVSKYYNSYGRFFLIQVRLRSSHMLCAIYNGIFQAKRF